jgi:A/G-specific adenine glycosylase
MPALPGGEWRTNALPPPSPIVTVRHGFTHFTLDLHVVRLPQEPTQEGWWQPLDRIAEAGLPTLYRTVVERVLSSRSKSRPSGA